MGKGSGKSQAQLDARSRSMNSQDAVGQAAIANRGVQLNPTSTAYKSSRGQPTANTQSSSEQSKE
jgi:hypothetical protein